MDIPKDLQYYLEEEEYYLFKKFGDVVLEGPYRTEAIKWFLSLKKGDIPTVQEGEARRGEIIFKSSKQLKEKICKWYQKNKASLKGLDTIALASQVFAMLSTYTGSIDVLKWSSPPILTALILRYGLHKLCDSSNDTTKS